MEISLNHNRAARIGSHLLADEERGEKTPWCHWAKGTTGEYQSKKAIDDRALFPGIQHAYLHTSFRPPL
jgi:hypothetical protein